MMIVITCTDICLYGTNLTYVKLNKVIELTKVIIIRNTIQTYKEQKCEVHR